MASLPPAAVAWRPPLIEGEVEWSIGQIIAVSRLYFASAYRNEGWLWAASEMDVDDQRSWLPWLDVSAARLTAFLKDTLDEWLTRRIELIDTPGHALSGWRLLMMMLEHEVHRRSQVNSYAGLQGWPVPDNLRKQAR